MPAEDEPERRTMFQYIWTNEPIVNQLKMKTEILSIKYPTIYSSLKNLGCKAPRNTWDLNERRNRIVTVHCKIK